MQPLVGQTDDGVRALFQGRQPLLGLFLAASLHASSALAAVECHEFQHSIFEPNRRLLLGDMDCSAGFYRLPSGPGLGVEPSKEALKLLKRL